MANRWSLCIGFSILLLLGTTALFAPLLAPRDPLSQNLDQDLIASSRQHPLGTDKLGRDAGARLSTEARDPAPSVAQSAAAAADPSHFRLGGSDRRRGQPELPRTRRRAADAVMGLHAKRRAPIPVGRAASHYLPRPRAH